MDNVVHRVASRRILTSRAPSFVATDPERAQRLVARHLHWLHRLDAAARDACLNEAVDALEDPVELERVLGRWHPDATLAGAH